MPTEIVPRVPGALARPQPRLPRQVSRQVDAAHHRGLVVAAKVRAAAFVTHTALTHVAQLSAEEAQLIQLCPLAEPRLKAVGDAFAGLAATEIMWMGI